MTEVEKAEARQRANFDWNGPSELVISQPHRRQSDKRRQYLGNGP